MGVGLSLYTVWALGRESALTVVDAFRGSLTRDKADHRLERFGRSVIARARMEVDVLGAEHVSEGRSYVVMFNHQSHIDIPTLYYALPLRTLRMVGKTELFKVPIWGRAMREGEMIEIDRSNRRQAIESLLRAGDAIGSGVSIGIAPEGHRTRDGKMGPLKKGGFHLARQTATPILPVAINGTYRVLPPDTIRMRPGMPVRVIIGAPIEVEDRDIDELMREVQAFYDANVEPIEV